MSWPHVTAIVNTYERPYLLKRALASVYAQDFTDFEVIVIHDGPASHATAHVCENYSQLFDARNVAFTFTSTDECSGYQCVPKNFAIYLSRGDYIAFLDDDNEWTVDHLSLLVGAIEDGEVWPDFTYGMREYVDDRVDKAPVLPVGPSPFTPFDAKAQELLARSPSFNFIDTSDALIARGALWRLYLATERMWNETYRRFGDWELFTRGVFFAGWRGKAVDAIVQRYHWHGGNIQLTRPAQETPKVLNAEDPRLYTNSRSDTPTSSTTT